jgi:hypothetical protein
MQVFMQIQLPRCADTGQLFSYMGVALSFFLVTDR